MGSWHPQHVAVRKLLTLRASTTAGRSVSSLLLNVAGALVPYSSVETPVVLHPAATDMPTAKIKQKKEKLQVYTMK